MGGRILAEGYCRGQRTRHYAPFFSHYGVHEAVLADSDRAGEHTRQGRIGEKNDGFSIYLDFRAHFHF
jgi:hypothetical protein